MIIEPISTGHVEAVSLLGTSCYPSNYYEDDASFESKILGYPQGCFMAMEGGVLLGYVISFPYILGEVHPLNFTYSPTQNPDCLYIHDLCVSPFNRGGGVGSALATRVLSIPIWPKALVSVLGSSPFWEELGFETLRNLNYHGGLGHYMIKRQ